MRNKRLKYSDSRQRRARVRPGRATAWEIKMALGYPATAQLPAGRYAGQVTGNGDVSVSDKQSGGKIVATKTCQELDALEQNEILNKTGMKVGVSYSNGQIGAPVGLPPVYANIPKPNVAGYAQFAAQNKNNPLANQQNIGAVSRSLLSLQNTIALIGGVGSSLLGLLAVLDRVGKMKSGVKEGVNTIKEASSSIKEGASKLTKATKLLEKLKKMQTKLQAGQSS